MPEKKRKIKATIPIREWLKSFTILSGTLIAYLLFTEFVYFEDRGGLFRQPHPGLGGFNTIFSLIVLYVIIRHFFLASYYRFREAGIFPIFAFAPILIYLFLAFLNSEFKLPDPLVGRISFASMIVVAVVCCFKRRKEAEQDAALKAQE